jgi:hypothetical protein
MDDNSTASITTAVSGFCVAGPWHNENCGDHGSEAPQNVVTCSSRVCMLNLARNARWWGYSV